MWDPRFYKQVHSQTNFSTLSGVGKGHRYGCLGIAAVHVSEHRLVPSVIAINP